MTRAAGMIGLGVVRGHCFRTIDNAPPREIAPAQQRLRWPRAHRQPVAAEIVGDDDVAWCQARGELLFDVSEEQLAIDRTVEQTRRDDTVTTQASNEGGCHPVPVWHTADYPLATRRTATAADHVRCHAAFVGYDQVTFEDLHNRFGGRGCGKSEYWG